MTFTAEWNCTSRLGKEQPTGSSEQFLVHPSKHKAVLYVAKHKVIRFNDYTCKILTATQPCTARQLVICLKEMGFNNTESKYSLNVILALSEVFLHTKYTNDCFESCNLLTKH